MFCRKCQYCSPISPLSLSLSPPPLSLSPPPIQLPTVTNELSSHPMSLELARCDQSRGEHKMRWGLSKSRFLPPSLLSFPYPLISCLYSGHSSGAEQSMVLGVVITSVEAVGCGGGGRGGKGLMELKPYRPVDWLLPIFPDPLAPTAHSSLLPRCQRHTHTRSPQSPPL